jgi:N-acetylglucosamine kinase-like BadF-type ATPase
MNASTDDELYLGVDGGGTHLRVVIINFSQSIIASLHGPSANIYSVGKNEAMQNLVSCIKSCLAQLSETNSVKHATFALAGVGTRQEALAVKTMIERTAIRDLIQNNIYVTNDTLAALWEGAKELPAILLVAGTGSHCLGINKSGKVARAMGVEYLLSDEGSAYYMGERVLRSVVKACDGRGPQTKLKEEMFNRCHFSSLTHLYEYIYSVPSIKQGVADFAHFATELAASGDAVAYQIVKDAVAELIVGVQAISSALALSQGGFELLTIGSVFEKSQLVRTLFEKAVSERFSGVIVKFDNPNAALGAAKLAQNYPNFDLWSCYEKV